MDDVKFLNEYKNRWYEISPTLFDEILNWLNDYASSQEATELNKSLEMDRIRWNTDYGDVYQSLNVAANWFSTRKIWLADAIDAMSGIHGVTIKPENHYYFDLNGRRKTIPLKGFNINNGKIWIK